MNPIPWRLIEAEVTVLRRQRSTVAWSLVFTVGALVVFFAVPAVQHASDPAHHGSAGGTNAFGGAVHVLGLIVGPLAAILIGVQAGAGDFSAGVFRDLATTGRSRVTLFAVRVPAALAVLIPITLAAFAGLTIASYALSDGDPTPTSALIAHACLFVVVAQVATCVIAVGTASTLGSRTGALVALIGWQLIVSRLLAAAAALGSVRNALLTTALQHFDPIRTPALASVTVTIAIAVVTVWLLTFLIAGAWRTVRIDA